jgi:hypothetical protein
MQQPATVSEDVERDLSAAQVRALIALASGLRIEGLQLDQATHLLRLFA